MLIATIDGSPCLTLFSIILSLSIAAIQLVFIHAFISIVVP